MCVCDQVRKLISSLQLQHRQDGLHRLRRDTDRGRDLGHWVRHQVLHAQDDGGRGPPPRPRSENFIFLHRSIK